MKNYEKPSNKEYIWSFRKFLLSLQNQLLLTTTYMQRSSDIRVMTIEAMVCASKRCSMRMCR